MPDPLPDRPLPSVPCTSHHRVHANGARFHVAEMGIGRPVVLLHGFPQHWYAWRGVATRLATVDCSQRPGSAMAGELLHRSLFAHEIPAAVLGRFDSLPLKVPTLLLAGELDPVVTPPVLRRTKRTPSLLRFEQLLGAGRWLPEERPSRVARVARNLFVTDRSTANVTGGAGTSSAVPETKIGELV